MTPEPPELIGSGDVPTILVKDHAGREILCFLEHRIPLDGKIYALLTPVDTPVCLVKIGQEGEDRYEIIESLEDAEPILSVADVVLQEHDLMLVRSAVTLTVSGELDEQDPDEIDEDMDEELESDDEGESDLYDELISFRADNQEYGLYIPLDPFFVVARLVGDTALVVEGEEFERVQPRIEAELDERERES
jgi:hypothetical protein